MRSRGHPLQHACFACRKSFKRPQLSGSPSRFMTTDQARGQWAEAATRNERAYKCPDCGGPAHFMGLDFKAPKRADRKAWREVQAFIVAGNTYYRNPRDP